MKRYHRRRTCSHTSPRRSPTMVTLPDSRFFECRWWNDGWTVKTVVTWRSSASMIPAPGLQYPSHAAYSKTNNRLSDLMVRRPVREWETRISVNNNNDNNHIQWCNSRFLYNLLTAPWNVSNTYAQVARVQITCNTSSAYHVQHVVLRATRYEGAAQLLSLTELTSHLFELYFITWTINRWRRIGRRSTRRKPLATSFRKCLILQLEDSSPKRHSNPHNSIDGRLGKQTC